MSFLKPHRQSSLRARMIASHATVIVVALAIVLVISAAWLRRNEREAQIGELRDLAVPLLVESRLITRDRPGTIREEVAADLFIRQAQDIGLRILVLDPDGFVLFDTEVARSLAGETLTPYAGAIGRVAAVADARDGFFSVSLRGRNRPREELFRDQVVLIAANGQLPNAGGEASVLMLVEPSRTAGVVARFLPPLLLALALALLVALATGYLMSRRLAAPVTRLTAAAQSMAGGDLEQRVPIEGPAEIGQLAASFNAMSHRVATSDRAQRTLLADVSHELRTPLTNVDGYVQALRDGMFRTDSERSAALQTISAEAARMKTLLNEILELARLESGQATLSLRSVDIGQVLEDVARRFASRAEEQEIALQVETSARTTIQADHDRLHRVLDNLVTNALRHTKPGGQITLAAHPAASGVSDPRHARIIVRDTGTGIPPDRLSTIFDRFVRASDVDQGFGLGLPIARQLVELHGGTIAIDSQVGQGTTVTIDLPIHG